MLKKKCWPGLVALVGWACCLPGLPSPVQAGESRPNETMPGFYESKAGQERFLTLEIALRDNAYQVTGAIYDNPEKQSVLYYIKGTDDRGKFTVTARDPQGIITGVDGAFAGWNAFEIKIGKDRYTAELTSFVWHECEMAATSVCGTWSWNRKKPRRLSAVWDNGAAATLDLEKIGRNIVVTRRDAGGTSAGLQARYEGVWNGGIISGTVRWTRNGETTKGTWRVDLSRNLERGPRV